MCGIAGSTRTDQATLNAMGERMGHRGPDADGWWLENVGQMGDRAGLAHTRLAVIDLSPGGAQPMASPCGRYMLAYNGEIYNYRELRAQMEAAGESFSSASDTEVLLRLLMRDGEDALSQLIGMFAFGLWDREEKSLLLARDRLGIKPLVFGNLEDGQLAFASEIHALRAHGGLDLGLDRDALSGYLACLYVPQPMTMHQGIRKLPPGHVLRWKAGKTEVKPYWKPAYTGERTVSVDEAVEELMPLVRDAVASRMVADVPVGCFLSGGIDSSVIAALMAQEAKLSGGDPIRTFTMTFDVAAYDERENAKTVADYIGSEHTELPAGADLSDRLDDMVQAFGEPFGNPTALLINDLSRKAREHVTVALVGDGGDEVFGGYPRYEGGILAQKYRRLPGCLRNGVIKPLTNLIPESTQGHHFLRRIREFASSAGLPDSQMYAAWVEYFSPEERQALLQGDTPTRPIADIFEMAPSPETLNAMQQTDLVSFLSGNLLAYGDAMSMQHSLELRLPLIDHRLVEAVGRISPAVRMARGKKTLLREVARRLLPDAIVDAPKRGFNPPMGAWLKGDLAPLMDERLSPARLTELGLNPQPVADLIKEFRRGGRDHSLKIWSLLVYESWSRGQA